MGQREAYIQGRITEVHDFMINQDETLLAQ